MQIFPSEWINYHWYVFINNMFEMIGKKYVYTLMYVKRTAKIVNIKKNTKKWDLSAQIKIVMAQIDCFFCIIDLFLLTNLW